MSERFIHHIYGEYAFVDLHNPIPQTDDMRDEYVCPKCLAANDDMYCGDVTIAPIQLQITDALNGVERKWLARRCHCSECNFLWDVILMNNPVCK